MCTSLNFYREDIMEMCRTKGWDHCSVEKVWLLLIEEIGELAGSIRRHNNCFKDRKKVKIEDELGDVFSYLFQIAGILNVDLDQMWKQNKIKSMNKKYYKDNNSNYRYEYRSQKYSRYSPNGATHNRMVQHPPQYDNSK